MFNVGDYSFETYYPGPGHSPDNIIIWFKKQRILYGSCLIKSVDDDNLGYLGDANKMEYASTIKKVQKKCPQPNYVIVGHGDWTDLNSVEHTRAMAEDLKKEENLEMQIIALEKAGLIRTTNNGYNCYTHHAVQRRGRAEVAS